jgi:hypothetical protein
MTVLLTVVAWAGISFFSAWFWGTAISRGGDPAECESQSSLRRSLIIEG